MKQQCNKCHSTEVARCKWVNPNDQTIYNADSGTTLEWCFNCQSETTIEESSDKDNIFKELEKDLGIIINVVPFQFKVDANEGMNDHIDYASKTKGDVFNYWDGYEKQVLVIEDNGDSIEIWVVDDQDTTLMETIYDFAAEYPTIKIDDLVQNKKTAFTPEQYSELGWTDYYYDSAKGMIYCSNYSTEIILVSKPKESTPSICEDDVISVATSICLSPSNEQIKYVLENYRDSGTDNWTEIVEQLLHEFIVLEDNPIISESGMITPKLANAYLLAKQLKEGQNVQMLHFKKEMFLDVTIVSNDTDLKSIEFKFKNGTSRQPQPITRYYSDLINIVI